MRGTGRDPVEGILYGDTPASTRGESLYSELSKEGCLEYFNNAGDMVKMKIPAGVSLLLNDVVPQNQKVRVTGPAVVQLKDRLIHADGGPAITDEDGGKKWYQHGKLHREDGPAVEFSNGQKAWWVHGKRHREDGPAVIKPKSDGQHLEYYEDNFRHREDGPAIVHSNGREDWYIRGSLYTKEEYPLALKQFLRFKS